MDSLQMCMVQFQEPLQQGLIPNEFQTSRQARRRDRARIHGEIMVLQVAAGDTVKKGLLDP